MSVQTNYSKSADPELEFELEDGRTVSIEITGSPDNKKRVDVCLESRRQWVFAVNDDSAGLIMTLNEGGQRIDDELPDWLEPLLRRIGLEGVET